MFFVRIDEQPRLQLLRRGSTGTSASRLIHKREQSAGRKRKSTHLPIATLIACRKQCRPEATMNECHFPADEFCGPDVAAGVEFLEAPKDFVRSGMRPPRSRDRLARDQADRAGQQFVLQE